MHKQHGCLSLCVLMTVFTGTAVGEDQQGVVQLPPVTVESTQNARRVKDKRAKNYNALLVAQR